MNNIITTFDLTKFQDLKCPMLDCYRIKNVRVPDMTKLANKVFYMEFEGGITAFKVLAWSMYTASFHSYNFSFLIQTPKHEGVWVNLIGKAFFPSIESLVRGEDKVDMPYIWDYNFLKNNDEVKLVNKGTSSERDWEFHQSYYYSDLKGTAVSDTTKIKYVLCVENGLYIGLHQMKGRYTTPQEVLANRFNGKDIIDFAEPTTIEIKIEIPSTEYVTRKLVLK
jgi:hypothetical protein